MAIHCLKDHAARHGDATSLAVMLARIAKEVDHSADGISALQLQISPHLDVLTEQMDFAVIQNIDRVEQTLRDIRQVLHDLTAAPFISAIPVDAAAATAGCKLNDVSCRLRDLQTPAPMDDLDLF